MANIVDDHVEVNYAKFGTAGDIHYKLEILCQPGRMGGGEDKGCKETGQDVSSKWMTVLITLRQHHLMHWFFFSCTGGAWGGGVKMICHPGRGLSGGTLYPIGTHDSALYFPVLSTLRNILAHSQGE